MPFRPLSFELPGLDSNQDKESQNLLCYRYTTGYRNLFMWGKLLACPFHCERAATSQSTSKLAACSTSYAAVLGQVNQERELLQLDSQIDRHQADARRKS